MKSTYASDLEHMKALILGRDLTAEERCAFVIREAQRLIRWLYDPTPENALGWMVGQRAVEEGLTDEPVNWGDLDVVDAQMLDDNGYLVTVEEASPEAIAFQHWLERRLADFGWKAKVITEW